MTARSTSKILVDPLVARGELSAEGAPASSSPLQDEVGGRLLETNVDQNVLLRGEFHGSFLGTNLYKRLACTTWRSTPA